MNLNKSFSDNQEAFGVFNDFDDFNATLGSRDNEREETICPEIELDEDNVKTTHFVDSDQGIPTSVIVGLNSGLSQYSTQVYVINQSEYPGYVNTESMPIINNTSDYGVISDAPISLLLMANNENQELSNVNEQMLNNSYYQSYLSNENEMQETENHIGQNAVVSTNIDPRIFIQGQSCSRRKKLKVTPKKVKIHNDPIEKEKFYYFEKARSTTMKRLRNYFRSLTKENRSCFNHAHEAIKLLKNDSNGPKNLTIQYLMDYFQPIIHLTCLNNQVIRDAINMDDIKAYASDMIDTFNKQEKERKIKFKTKYNVRKRTTYKEPDINTKNKILSRIFCRDIQKIAEQINKTPPHSPQPVETKLDDKSMENLQEESKLSMIVDPANEDKKVEGESNESTPLLNLKKRVELLKKLQKSTLSSQNKVPNQSIDNVKEINNIDGQTQGKPIGIPAPPQPDLESPKETPRSLKSELNSVNQPIDGEEQLSSVPKKKPKLSQNLLSKNKGNKEVRRVSTLTTPLPYNYSSKNIEDVINQVASFQPQPTPPKLNAPTNQDGICTKMEICKSDGIVKDKGSPTPKSSALPSKERVSSKGDGQNDGAKPKAFVTAKSIKRKPLAFTNNPSPNNLAPPMPQAKMAAKPDAVSMKVVRHFADILGDRIKSQRVVGGGKKSDSGLNVTLGKKVEEIAEQIERAMRNAYPYNATDPTPDSKYKAKYRALLYNLKDPKNKVYTKLITGEVDANTLVQMSQEDISFYRSSSGLASKSSFKIPNKSNATKPNPSNGLLGSPPKSLSFSSDYIPTTASSALSSYNTAPSYRTGGLNRDKDERNKTETPNHNSESQDLRCKIKNESPKFRHIVPEEKIFWTGSISFGELISQSTCAQSFNATGKLLYRTIPNDIEFTLPEVIKCRSRILPEIVFSKLKNLKTALISFEQESTNSSTYQSLFNYLSENKRFSTCDDLIMLRERSALPAELYIAPIDASIMASFTASYPKQILEKLKVGGLLGIVLYDGKSLKSSIDEPQTDTGNLESVVQDSKTDDVLDFFKSLNSSSLPFGDADYRIIPPLSIDILQKSKGLAPKLDVTTQPSLDPVNHNADSSLGVSDDKEVTPINSIPNLDDLLSKVAVSLKTIEEKEQEITEDPIQENLSKSNPSINESPLEAILTLLNSAGVASTKK